MATINSSGRSRNKKKTNRTTKPRDVWECISTEWYPAAYSQVGFFKIRVLKNKSSRKTKKMVSWYSTKE